MNHAIVKTNFNFPGQSRKYEGKVRDVYYVGEMLVMIVTDRISAFDVILPEGIPFKGQVLNQIAERFLDATRHIVPNWKIACPDPNATVGYFAEPFMVEMVVRGYLTGHAWRHYKEGNREICGLPLPGGMKEHQKFPEPIITPTTKAMEGHDEDISKEEIISGGLVSREEYEQLERISLELFRKGTEMAHEKGLILVDTKYEFGKKDGEIILIDEVHTPDSSRYFYLDGYKDRFKRGEPQKQLSKEFVREWLISEGFQGQTGQKLPVMSSSFINRVSERYIELFERITGAPFLKGKGGDPLDRIEENITGFLKDR